MKTPIAKMIPLLARGVAPTAAVVSGLLSPLALGATGDLDPAFADVGRIGPLSDFAGPAWSILAAQDDDEIIFAGGDSEVGCDSDDFYCYYYNYYESDASNFLGRLSDTGSIDLSFAAARLENTEVFDVALQPDGKVVAVGRTVQDDRSTLTVFRLEREGSLDPTFGESGIIHFTTGQAMELKGSSVALDPDGGIVVAGSKDNELIVLRLLATGALDNAFGVSGLFIGPANDFGSRTHVLRTGGGGYRVTTNFDFPVNGNPTPHCRVVALTATGAVDVTFGTLGIAPVKTPSGASVTCSSMVAQPDGRLLVAGSEAALGFAVRLLTNGEGDASFATNAVSDAMEDATALAVGGDGSIVVAGRGPTGVPGALLVRLQANGELDVLFGNAGSTWIDLPSDHGTTPLVHDLTVLSDGRVVAAGGDYGSSTPHPFVVRLLGEGGGDGPGVLGVMHPSIAVKEQSQEAVVTVRRMGGDSGSVSVGYQTLSNRGVGAPPATGGQDYTQVEGRLSWSDGDASDRQIVVPIASNDNFPEEHERFVVALGDAQGGAGLGTRNATVEILGDGDPFGQFAIEVLTPFVRESESAQVLVHRNFYASGAVSVTLTPMPGTATPGADYAQEPVTVSWADGDSATISVAFTIHNDTSPEKSEAFTVALSNPTGGAIVGPRSTASISIAANDQPPPGSSGGGGLGYLSLLMLGAAGLLRSAWVAAQSLGSLRKH